MNNVKYKRIFRAKDTHECHEFVKSLTGQLNVKYDNEKLKTETTQKHYMTPANVMCSTCFNTFKFSFTSQIELAVGHTPMLRSHNFHVAPSYSFFMDSCPWCGTPDPYLIPIDANLARSISLFNQKGYRTKFCCEGHSSSVKSIDNTYVMFEDTSIFEHIDILPDTWVPDWKSLKKYGTVILEASNHFGFGYFSPMNSYYDKRIKSEICDDLYHFAQMLPERKI